MSDYIAGKALRKLLYGKKVDRATATLPQGTTESLFNVEGGRVLVTLIVGEVTTAIQNQTNNVKLVANPDTGTTVDMCANLDIDDDEIGTLYTIAGAPGTAMQDGMSGAVEGQDEPVVVAAGAIQLTCSASNTGSVKWTLFYVPIDDGAYVEAA